MSNWHLEDVCAKCGSRLATDGDRIWCTHETPNFEDKSIRASDYNSAEVDEITLLQKENEELRESLGTLYILYTERWMAEDLYMRRLAALVGKEWQGREKELLKYIENLEEKR